MNAKNIAIVLVASIALLALLGCVQQPPSGDGQPPTGGQQQAGGEQVIGPEYYNSEQEAFNALNEELQGMDEPSPEELEAMLGG